MAWESNLHPLELFCRSTQALHDGVVYMPQQGGGGSRDVSGQKSGTRRSTNINNKQIHKQTEATEHNLEQVELQAKLLDYFLWSNKSNIRIQSNYSFSYNSAQQLSSNGEDTYCSFPKCLTTSRPVFMYAMPVSEKSSARRNAGALQEIRVTVQITGLS